MLPDRDGVRRGVAVLAAAALAVALAGCVDAAEPAPTPTGSATSDPAPTPTPTSEPELIPDGSAEENLPYFDLVNQRLIEEEGEPKGRAFIDNLVAAGFDKAAMEVTPDRTSVDLSADNIQFSVLINGTCLVGQYGNVGYHSAALPVLETGRCMVGETRPIDW